MPDHWYEGPNPLLDALPSIDNLDVLTRALVMDPMAGVDVRAQDILDRDEWLVSPKQTFRPTGQSVRIAATFLNMLRGNYRARNPLCPRVRREVWRFAASASEGSQVIPASGIGKHSVLALMGVTGTGKSTIVDAFRSVFPQVIDHAAFPEAGWVGFKQLVYLYTNLSHDGSRGGFLTAILLEMDSALGTNYADTLVRKAKSIENLIVRTVAQLQAHHIGILFIDEGQLKNLVESSQAELMQMFLLSIINSGIPLVLIGNPLAFTWVDDCSQDIRRLYQKGFAYIHPIGAISEPCMDQNWEVIRRSIMGYYVLRDAPRDSAECSATLRRCSGGVPGLADSLWCQSQRTPLYEGREFVRPSDILAVYESAEFAPLRDLADGFASKNPALLARYNDVPYLYYGRIWGVEIESSADPTTSGPTPDQGASGDGTRRGARGSRARSEQSKLQARRTRERKKAEKRQKLQESLVPEDMRAGGLKETLLQGLDAAREEAAKNGQGDLFGSSDKMDG